MVQVRKLVLAIAAASALSSGMAQALGLGELTLKSTPNQPLVAEIELLDVKELTAAEVVPSLASPEEFAKAGVDRQAFLNDLTFTTVLNPSGKSVLRVTSSKPLSEPMVKFLVQVMWPNGRLLRDYSVLVDPSKFSPQTAEAAAQPAPVQGAEVNTPLTAAGKSAQYTTSRHDTLWEIAAKARNGGSVQQTMLAIQALNPDAFIDGNINRLKTGQVLRLPDSAQSTSLPQPKAIAEVAAQNTAWRQGRRLASGPQQLDARKRARGDAAPSQTAAKDQLSLVSADSGKGRGKGAGGDSKVLSSKLAVTQESLDTTRRDNAELKSRMTDLQSQLDKLQRLIELKNNQLAKLQAEGAGATQPSAVMPAELVANPAPAQPAVTPAASAPQTPAPDAAAPAAVPAEAPIEATTPPAEESKYNDLLTNPVLLGLVGGGALVLALLLLLLARRRRAQQEADKHLRMARALAEEPAFSNDLDMPESSFEGLEVPPPSVKLDPAPAPIAPIAPVVVVAPIAAPLVARAVERSDDVLTQAQSHIDRGALNQAAEILEVAIKQEPQRSDLRLKLMEVYGAQGDRDAFVVQERQLVANGKNYAEVEQLKSRFPEMVVVAAAAGLGAAAAAAASDAQYVKDLLLDEPEEPAPAAAAVAAEDPFDTDFDLSLDDMETAPAAVVTPEPELDAFPMEDDLSFESVLQQQAEAKESLDDLSDFDLDLGGDVPASTLADDDFLLSLDEPPKDLPATEAPTVPQEASIDDLELPADFDLSLSDEMDAHVEPDTFAAELDDVNAELGRLSQSLEQPPIAQPFAEPHFTAEDAAATADDEPEFDFLSGTDEVATKLDLAQAYIDMGDSDGARDILAEVLSEGSEVQKSEAKEMLTRLVG
jgi:pilus assembly protein FimV